MAMPAAIVSAALFMLPASWSDAGRIGYLLITNLLFTSVILTALDIPYASIQVVRTNSQEERSNIGIWRAAFGYIAGMVIVLSIIPVTNALGGMQEAWIKYGIVCGLVILLTLLICWRKAKETATENQQTEKGPQEELVPFRDSLRMLFHNKYWIMTLFMGFISQIYYGISGSSITYYAKWIFGDDNLTAVLGGVGMIPTLLGFGLTNIMIKK